MRVAGVEVKNAAIAAAVGGRVSAGADEVEVGLAEQIERALVVPRVDLTGIDTSKHGSAALPVIVDLSQAEAILQPPTVKVTW